MPKKFAGTNSKAVEARARKSAQKEEDKQKKDAEAEDEMWKDDDKHVNRKLARKNDKEQKRIHLVEKKKELQQLHDEEMSKIKTVKPVAQTKVTRSDIAANAEQEYVKYKGKPKNVEDDLPPLEENMNRIVTEGEARTVEEAINILGISEQEVDSHPEKRMKAAFKKFEEEHLPIFKRENPNLRLTQVKQLLQKEWMKSSDNPLVQIAMKQ